MQMNQSDWFMSSAEEVQDMMHRKLGGRKDFKQACGEIIDRVVLENKGATCLLEVGVLWRRFELDSERRTIKKISS